MSGSEDDSIGRRETAYRLFASEFEDADFSYAESDEERAPNYVVTPTGARVNRLFVVGVLTEVQAVSEDVLRARVVDPTGAFVVYAGQYQPDAQAFLERADPPTFVAVSGKARTFQPEDSDVIYTSIRPESVNEVDADTRDRWVVGTAEQTLKRISNVASALRSDVRGDDLRAALQANGISEGLAAGIPLAIDHYGTGGAYLQALRETALDAARVVAGSLDEVEARSVAPDASGEADLSALTDRHLDTSGVTSAEPGAESPAGAVDAAVESTTD
jgi:RPA family protein